MIRVSRNTRFWTLLAVIGLGLILLGYSQARHLLPQQWSQWQTGRAQELAAEEPAHARRMLLAVLAQQPRHLPALRALATLERANGHGERYFLHLQNLHAQAPEDTDAALELAKLWLRGGAAEQAEQVLTQSIAVAPPQSALFSLRARTRLLLSRHHGAAMDAQRAVDLSPADGTAWQLWLDAWLAHEGAAATIRRYEASAAAGVHPGLQASIASLRTRAADEPGWPAVPEHARLLSAARQRAALAENRPAEAWPGALSRQRSAVEHALRQQQYALAESLAEEAEQDFPGTVFGPWLRGLVALAQNQAGEAAQAFEQALRRAPRSNLAISGLARALGRASNLAETGDRLAQIAAQDPAYDFVRRLAVHAYERARLPDRAEAVLRQALQQAPQLAAPQADWIAYLLRMDLAHEARGELDALLQRFPDDAELQRLAGDVMVAVGDETQALPHYAAAATLAPDEDLNLARWLLARVQRQDPPAQTLASARTLASNTPLQAPALHAVGWALFQASRAPQGLAWLEAAVMVEPDSPANLYALAQADVARGEHGRARRGLQRALSLGGFGDAPEAQKLLNRLPDPAATQ